MKTAVADTPNTTMALLLRRNVVNKRFATLRFVDRDCMQYKLASPAKELLGMRTRSSAAHLPGSTPAHLVAWRSTP
jgi:hypothetical protein